MRYIVLTFDDGTIYDKKFIALLKKYNLTCSLNLNSGLDDFIWYYNDEKEIKRLKLSENKNLYDGFEICSHSFTHPHMTMLNDGEVIKQVTDDINRLEEVFQREITTFAFPFHDYNEDIIEIIKNNTKVKNIRISKICNDYLPLDRFHIHLNAFYDDEDVYDKLDEFSKNNLDKSIFTIVGHSYEFEVKNDWEKIERLLQYLEKLEGVKVTTIEEAMNDIYQ